MTRQQLKAKLDAIQDYEVRHHSDAVELRKRVNGWTEFSPELTIEFGAKGFHHFVLSAHSRASSQGLASIQQVHDYLVQHEFLK